MTTVLLVPLALGLLAAQTVPMPPRDARPSTAPAGTAIIRGRVYNDETGQPVRRAIVMLMPFRPQPTRGTPDPPVAMGALAGPGMMSGRPRNTMTDNAGRFEFTALAAGGYRVRAMPSMYAGQYLGGVYGGRDTMDPGRTIDLVDGQVFEQADVALRRGAAVSGRILDESGDPVTRVMVFPARVMPGTGTIQRTGGGFIQSDDHGRYRVFGLEPGDYVIGAEARGMGGPPLDDVETEGFVTTFHPSTASDREATRVRVRAGGEIEGVDIQLIRTRTFKVSGTVMDSQGRMVARPNASLVRQGPGGMFTGSGFSVDPGGRFTIRDVVPGDYTLVVRPSFGEAPGAPTPTGEFAAVPISVAADVDNLVVVTQPGATVTGQVVFAEGQPPAVGSLQVMAQPGRSFPSFGSSGYSTVGSDLRFTLTNVFGPVQLRLNIGRPDWAVKAVMLGATDVTDTPVELRKEHSGHLQIIVTTRAAAIEGTVTNDNGSPADQALVIVFPEDRDRWKTGTSRTRTAVTRDGKYSVGGLIGGNYLAIAVPPRSVMLTPDTPPEFFESLAREATRLVVVDDEKRIVDLRLSRRQE